MARYATPITQYLNDAGNPLDGGKLSFLASGTEVLQDTFSDQALTIARTNPVILDAAGRAGNIWMQDLDYKVRLYDSADVMIWEIDPYLESTGSGFDPWSSTVTYVVNSLVEASNGKFYISISASNTNQDPTTTPAYWTQFDVQRVWNTNEVYLTDAWVKGSNGKLYVSLTSSNQGNNPVTDTTNWKPVEQISGTFTPTLWDSTLSDGEGQTYTKQLGWYTLMGNRVFFNITMRMSSKGTLTAGDQAIIGGLPFSQISDASCTSVVSVGSGQGWTIATGTTPVGTIEAGDAYVRLGLFDSTGGVTALLVSEINTSGELQFSGQYPT